MRAHYRVSASEGTRLPAEGERKVLAVNCVNNGAVRYR
jgi:hypothetical protein